MFSARNLFISKLGRTYATWNPLDKNASITLTNGNNTATAAAGTNYFNVRATQGKSSGKWYWEITFNSFTANNEVFGIGDSGTTLGGSTTTYVGSTTTSWGYASSDGKLYNNSAATGSGTITTYTSGDVIGLALDMGAGKLDVYKNNTLVWTIASGISGTYFPMISGAGAGVATANFGASAFSFTPPVGYNSGVYI